MDDLVLLEQLIRSWSNNNNITHHYSDFDNKELLTVNNWIKQGLLVEVEPRLVQLNTSNNITLQLIQLYQSLDDMNNVALLEESNKALIQKLYHRSKGRVYEEETVEKKFFTPSYKESMLKQYKPYKNNTHWT